MCCTIFVRHQTKIDETGISEIKPPNASVGTEKMKRIPIRIAGIIALAALCGSVLAWGNVALLMGTGILRLLMVQIVGNTDAPSCIRQLHLGGHVVPDTQAVFIPLFAVLMLPAIIGTAIVITHFWKRWKKGSPNHNLNPIGKCAHFSKG